MATAKDRGWSEAPDPQTVNEFHTKSDVDANPDSQHHTIGPGVHQSASGAHNHRGGNGAPILNGISLTGSKSGENSVLLTSIVSALIEMGIEDKTT